jgi:hypothetical protein
VDPTLRRYPAAGSTPYRHNAPPGLPVHGRLTGGLGPPPINVGPWSSPRLSKFRASVYVAFMLHGAAGNLWQSLILLGKILQHARH